ncbi:unnamed protein product [Rotaria socialis]|uniref:F-box domain-containing protein n=1 Tax=Rotaria socialis TaxID=392032 RepID=A0A818ADF3_9BILA|nr:unnamed protein product [Rotaria socialis]CAF4711078.1 unnamed protein product [Rotaria socialis]
MERSLLGLNDLPDKVLIIILKNLSQLEAISTFIDVNKRLKTIVCDSIFTDHLTLMRCLSDKFCRPIFDPLLDPMLDRFCLQILPEIHRHIKWLNLESSSMERILGATNYPNLYGLGLYNMDTEIARSLFTEESFFGYAFKKQISSIVINNVVDKKLISMRHTLLFTQIFSLFTNLKYLYFDPSARYSSTLSFDNAPPTVVSSTLVELHVTFDKFNDCLYLLDGRFNQLQTLYVSMFMIPLLHPKNSNKEKIPNLKCFSLHCDEETKAYDELIVPLIQRISNLEKLDLCFTVISKPTFVDGNDLKKNIINRLLKLKKFSFNIRSIIDLDNQTNLPSNEDIQQTFQDFQDNQIISCIDYFLEVDKGECLIYSYPYRLKDYDQISNNFSGGIFKCVRTVTLCDEHPFEHEFFLRISQSFPFLKILTVMNDKPQRNKLQTEPKKNNRALPIIRYSHLVKLDLTDAHDDYIEQFLVDWKTSLSNVVRLSVFYRPLLRVTRNFTRNTTRLNCTKVIPLCIYDNGRLSQHIKDYFPSEKVFEVL